MPQWAGGQPVCSRRSCVSHYILDSAAMYSSCTMQSAHRPSADTQQFSGSAWCAHIFCRTSCAMTAQSLHADWCMRSFCSSSSQTLPCTQGVRVRVTPLWQLTTSQSSSALLELPVEDLPDSARLAAALVICRQPHAQVRLHHCASCAFSQWCTMHTACNCRSSAGPGGIGNIATALTIRNLHAHLSSPYLIT